MNSGFELKDKNKLWVKQVHELAEWIGFESRNKYQILDEQNKLIGYAAEQQKGIWGFLLRQALGHFRTFDVLFYDNARNLVIKAHHPFRWFFERIEIYNSQSIFLGAIQKRFSFLTKRFDVEDNNGHVILEVASPIWKIWTFTFNFRNLKVAEVKKTWSGLLSEALTDRDNFQVEFHDQHMNENIKQLVLVSSVFIDLLYFEHKR